MNYLKFIKLGNRKYDKLKDTVTFSNCIKNEGEMLKTERDAPFLIKLNLQSFVWLCGQRFFFITVEKDILLPGLHATIYLI